MAELTKEAQGVMDGLMENLARAAELGLIPQSGSAISRKGEFIVNPSNLEEMEDKRMRGYRYKAFPKHVHGWHTEGESAPTPVSKEVANQKEFDAALADGWFEDNDPKHAPKAVSKVASVASHRVADAKSGRTEIVTSHPEDAPAETVAPTPKAKAGKPRGRRAK